MIDLLEMCPLENQFQDFIVYPVLDEIIHKISLSDLELVDCHNFRQYNTESHDRRNYSVLVKAVPDLLIAKNFFYRNRKKEIFDLLSVCVAVEVKEPNNNWMLGRNLVKDESLVQSKDYKDYLYVELLSSLVKNKKVILTNIRKWEIYNIDVVNEPELRKQIQIYVNAIELCGFDSFTDYKPSEKNSRIKVLKECVVKERVEKLKNINEITDVLSGLQLIDKDSFDELVKKLDKKYMDQIKEFVRKSHVQTWNIINDNDVLEVDRYASINDNHITVLSDLNYDMDEWSSLKTGLYQFINANP